MNRYKYTILDRMKKLSVYDYENALKFFPKRFKIAEQTFRNWIYIQKGAKAVIPIDCLYEIALFFKCSPIDLYSDWEEAQQQIFSDWEKFKERHLSIAEGHVQD